ncbi:hypothetical protein ACEPAG_4947 [Sanghuangporus baumii]
MSSISSSPSSLSVYQAHRTVPITVKCSGFTKKGQLCKNKVKVVVPSSETQQYIKKLVEVFCYLHKYQEKVDEKRVPCPGPIEKSERRGDHVEPESPSEAAHPDSMPERTYSQHKSGSGLKGVNGDKIQCNGTAARDRRCRAQVSCAFHRFLLIRSYQWRRTQEKVLFCDYIPEYLSRNTQTALREEMMKPPSDSDVPGFVYAFQVRDKDRFTVKVGRTSVDLNKRLGQWKKACSAMEQKLLGWWPGNIMIKNFTKTPIYSRIEPGPKGVYTRKLERLVHLELADLALYDLYNSRNIIWPKGLKHALPFRKFKNLMVLVLVSGKRHKEIFSFKRPRTSSLNNEEWDEQIWDEVVMPVIERWGRFVTLFW